MPDLSKSAPYRSISKQEERQFLCCYCPAATLSYVLFLRSSCLCRIKFLILAFDRDEDDNHSVLAHSVLAPLVLTIGRVLLPHRHADFLFLTFGLLHLCRIKSLILVFDHDEDDVYSVNAHSVLVPLPLALLMLLSPHRHAALYPVPSFALIYLCRMKSLIFVLGMSLLMVYYSATA